MSNLLEAFDITYCISGFDEDAEEKAREIFSVYHDKGVILSDSFDANYWVTTDEYHQTVGIDFTVEEPFAYKRSYESIFGITYTELILQLKIFVTTMFHKYVLDSIRGTVHNILKLVSISLSDLTSGRSEVNLYYAPIIMDFISLISANTETSEEIDSIMQQLEYSASETAAFSGKRRLLAPFSSYFLFGHILDDYWEMEQDPEKKLFFYPLYLWWHITAIKPMRPREFIVTPRDCLSKKDGHWYLTTRYDRLKGSSMLKEYDLEKDFPKDIPIRIPDDLAEKINEYIEQTKNYPMSKYNTLFVTLPHYKHFGQSVSTRMLSYCNMRTILERFYSEVVENIYHLHTVYDRDESGTLAEGTIHYIQLGDTRHLALINLLADGGTPVLAMELAHHTDMETSFHYGSNIAELVKCKTYDTFRRISHGSVEYTVPKPLSACLRATNPIPIGNDYFCYSKKFAENDYSDCLNAIGPHSEVAYCNDCVFCGKSTKSSIVSFEEKYTKKIDDECEHLRETIRLVRGKTADEEDIISALLRIKSSAYSYQQYLLEKGETNDGKARIS